MKTLPERYQCEICNRIYDESHEAQTCESSTVEVYLCVGGNSLVLDEDDIPDSNHPTFKRMVTWLQKNRPDIPITTWGGEKPVAYECT